MQIDEVMQLVETMRELGTDITGVEAKASSVALPKSVRETLSAFSNTSGGTIILGVAEDDDFSIVGVADPSKISADLASTCATEMEPPLRPVITQMQIEDAWIVVAEVPEIEGSQKPCYVKARGMSKGSYLRVHDGDQGMSAFEVQMLLSSRGQPTNDIESVPGTSEADLDDELVEAFILRSRQLHAYATSGLDKAGILRQSKVIVKNEDGIETLSLGGLLAMGRYPQGFLPQLTITFVNYPTERGPDVANGIRFLDNVTLDGPIPVMARDALAVLRRNMSRRSTVTGIGRTDTWEYPEAALREAIVNALVHRDLSAGSRGAQIQIEMYPDRLAVRNPGGLFGPVSVSDLTASGTSSSRNSFLLRILEDVVIPGEDRAVCENRGSGIRTIVEALRDAGMTVPNFEDKISSFSVTFPNHTLLDAATVSWITQLDEAGLTDSQCVGLAMLRSGGRLDNLQYRAATGVDSRIATTELQDLVIRELVTQVGTGRWTEYRLAARVNQLDPDVVKRLSPRDRRPLILSVLEDTQLSRAEIEKVTGLSRKVLIRWLGILRKEHLVKTVGDVSPQSPTVKYERTPESWGQGTLDFEIPGN
jgi:ATP-dependent DNA helicase RecG